MKKIKDFWGTVRIEKEAIAAYDEQGIMDLAEEELRAFCVEFKKGILKYWLLTRPLVKKRSSKKRFWERR